MTDIIQFVLPSNCNYPIPSVDEEAYELIPNDPPDGDPPNVSGQTLIRRIALKSIGMRNKSKQEGCNMTLKEPLYHTDHAYININLDKSDTCEPQKDATPERSPTYSKYMIFMPLQKMDQNLGF